MLYVLYINYVNNKFILKVVNVFYDTKTKIKLINSLDKSYLFSMQYNIIRKFYGSLIILQHITIKIIIIKKLLGLK